MFPWLHVNHLQQRNQEEHISERKPNMSGYEAIGMESHATFGLSGSATTGMSSPVTLGPSTNYSRVDYPTGTLVVSVISCSLSLTGAFFIFATYGFIAEIRTPVRRLIVTLTLADCISAAGYLISVIRYLMLENNDFQSENKDSTTDTSLCVAQSIITSYSSIVSFLLTIAICVHVCHTVYTHTDRTGSMVWFWIFNGISWIIPAIVVAIAANFDIFGEGSEADSITGPWCWVKPGNSSMNIMWMLLAGKAWEILCYLITAALYFFVKITLYFRYRKRNQPKPTFHEVHGSFRDDDANILFIWLPLYVVRLWGTIRFFLLISDETPNDTYENVMKAFLDIQAFGDPSQAFCNFVIFVLFDHVIRSKLRNMVVSKCRRGSVTTLDNESTSLLNSSINITQASSVC